MREFGITILSLLAMIGLCVVLVIATRGNDNSDKDKDNAFMTLMRGLGTLAAIFGALTTIGVVIYLISLLFS